MFRVKGAPAFVSEKSASPASVRGPFRSESGYNQRGNPLTAWNGDSSQSYRGDIMVPRCKSTCLALAGAFAVGLAADEPVRAQSNSLFGSRGPSGQIGSNLTGSRVGRSTTMGSGMGAGGRGGGGLTGQPLTGGLGGGNVGAGAGMQTGQTGQAGTQQSFVGRRNNAGRFVGDQRVGQQTTAGSAYEQGATGRSRNFGNRAFGNRGMTRNGNQRGGRSGQGSESEIVVRPRYRVAFSHPEPAARSVQSSLQAQFERTSSRASGLQGVEIRVGSEGVAVLQGTVDSEADRRLAAMIARMEPGIRSVRNELTVREEP